MACACASCAVAWSAVYLCHDIQRAHRATTTARRRIEMARALAPPTTHAAPPRVSSHRRARRGRRFSPVCAHVWCVAISDAVLPDPLDGHPVQAVGWRAVRPDRLAGCRAVQGGEDGRDARGDGHDAAHRRARPSATARRRPPRSAAVGHGPPSAAIRRRPRSRVVRRGARAVVLLGIARRSSPRRADLVSRVRHAKRRAPCLAAL